MRLVTIMVQRFRNFTDAQTMQVEPNVTCLVGKNESGKTTVLKALHRLNPANSPDKFDLAVEYPRRRLARDRRKDNLGEVSPIVAWFSLEPGDIPKVTATLGFEPPDGTEVRAQRTYDDDLWVDVTCSLSTALEAAGSAVGVDPEDIAELAALPDLATVQRRVAEVSESHRANGNVPRATALNNLLDELKRYEPLLHDWEVTDEQSDEIAALLPRFFYFSDYELLQGETDLEELAKRVEAGQLERGDETMIALLGLAGQEPKSFLDEEYVTRKAELQAASSDLTRQVMKYWKQNPALSVRFDTDMPIVSHAPDGTAVRHRFLKVELHDARHDVDTNFATRSAGFQWFFSFLAAFSIYQDSDERVVVLLDEPGTSLHGEAQREFVSYIFDELGTHQQVLYTTHSQHMLDPTKYETMRAVHDRATIEEPELGVVITPVDLSADRGTVLPVEAALGYTVAQHLFLGRGPHLVVEGSSDFVYLMKMSAYLTARDRQGLDPRISIIPIGGVTNMPAFIALFGRRLDVRALVDGAETNKVAERIQLVARSVGVDRKKIVILGETPGLPNTADIEDLFTVKDYLWLYNRALPVIEESELPQTPEPILRRISLARGKFDHAGPAHQLTKDHDLFFAQVDDETLNRFEELFAKLVF
ncbi:MULTISPECIES: AAA family ATPase [unclassified Saccharothrix]|uniref:AAA family ATPase n=1 Tax=unclassified Saccharothrix TaxID=2593673 RepID=UPI00307D90A6